MSNPWRTHLFCCASGLDDNPGSTGSTCLLYINHAGPCEFTRNSLLPMTISEIRKQEKEKKVKDAVTKS